MPKPRKKRGRTSPVPLNTSSSSSDSPQGNRATQDSSALTSVPELAAKEVDTNSECQCDPILGFLEEKLKMMKETFEKKIQNLLEQIRGLKTGVDTKKKEERQLSFVIHGIPETEAEKPKEVEQKVISFLKTKMKIPEKDASDMVNTTFRMGKAKLNDNQSQNTTRKSRPVLLKLLKEKFRPIFTGHLFNLKNTNLKVESYLLEEERKNKNILMKYRKEAKLRGDKVKMIGDEQLMVNDLCYTVRNNTVCLYVS